MMCSCGWHLPVLDVQTEDGGDLPPVLIILRCPLCLKTFRSLKAQPPPAAPTERELAEDRAVTLAEERD
jgi:hypothetical protein